MLYLEIVKSHFVNIAGVKPDAATPVVRGVSDFRQQLSIRIERHLGAFDPNFQLVRSGSGMNRTRLRLLHQRRLNTVFVHDDFILRFRRRIDQQRVVFELLLARFALLDEAVGGEDALDAGQLAGRADVADPGREVEGAYMTTYVRSRELM